MTLEMRIMNSGSTGNSGRSLSDDATEQVGAILYLDLPIVRIPLSK